MRAAEERGAGAEADGSSAAEDVLGDRPVQGQHRQLWPPTPPGPPRGWRREGLQRAREAGRAALKGNPPPRRSAARELARAASTGAERRAVRPPEPCPLPSPEPHSAPPPARARRNSHFAAADPAPTTAAATVTSRRRAACPAPRAAAAPRSPPAVRTGLLASAALGAAPRRAAPRAPPAPPASPQLPPRNPRRVRRRVTWGILGRTDPEFVRPTGSALFRPTDPKCPEHRAPSPCSARRGTARVPCGIPVLGRRGRPLRR
ncbi:testis-specific gene A8 protein-like [Mus musculus]|uniref:testis-specific gene A8 protein-like n=1 Tax=Mus musculus TaxID=10090 RepID=UPI001679903C|nr:testis-specific gene A8 protein-like [Mus musculus]